jgi:transglutaminase-like putative cysteine protease
LAAVLCAALLAVPFITRAAAEQAAHFPAPSNDAKRTFEKGGATIDYGNASQGYILVKHSPTSKRLKVRITLGKGTYTYDLNGQGAYEVFPLQMGDGKYKVQLFQEARGGQYAALASKSFEAALETPTIVYLYPNQFVNYNAGSATVAKSMELCQGLEADADKVKAVFDFCRKNIIYHFERARSYKPGYLPDLDAVLADRMGICFDYAAVMACMLRVQNIPTQLTIGYADTGYHAWNTVLVNGQWYRYDATFAAMGTTAATYTEDRRY